MTRVLVLGAAGMLGSMLCDVLGAEPTLDVVGSRRDGDLAFDACVGDPGALLDASGAQWAVNAIGVLKARIDADRSESVSEAIEVNALFPHRLAHAAAQRGARVIAIATDGVFSGRDGPYAEDAAHDASDVYGQTKSLGEAPGEHVLNLRCSIVGPDPGAARSLLAWLVAQPPGARVPGFSDQRWNGLTTLHLARVCAGIVRTGASWRGTAHAVPADVVSKGELLELLARTHGRDDLHIVHGPSPAPAERSLATLDEQRNRALWRAAGYEGPPTIAAMVDELAAWRAR